LLLHCFETCLLVPRIDTSPVDVCDLGNYERGALGYNWNIG